jgi:hypothetical protein
VVFSVVDVDGYEIMKIEPSTAKEEDGEGFEELLDRLNEALEWAVQH